MQVETALHAMRILGVDIANLTTQCAMYRAQVEQAQELAIQIGTEVVWTERDAEDGGKEVATSPDSVELIRRLVYLLS
jgi:hypothetical protein